MIKIYLSNTLQEDIIALIKQLYAKGVKMCIMLQDQQYTEEYSKLLWNQRVFLPHAIMQDTPPANLTQEEWCQRQPIFLTTPAHSNVNNAPTCIYVDLLPTQIVQTDVFFCHINNTDIITQLKQNKHVCYVKTGNIWHESKQ